MKATLTILQQDIKRLRNFIQGIELHVNLSTCDPQKIQDTTTKEKLKEYQDFYASIKTEKAILDYTTIIVNLYSAFETFIEGTIMGYLSELNRIVPSFEELPEKIKNNHNSLSAQLLLNLKLQKFHGTITEKAIIENLHSCVGNPGLASYVLNVLAFTAHNSNFRVGSINEFFSYIPCLLVV